MDSILDKAADTFVHVYPQIGLKEHCIFWCHFRHGLHVVCACTAVLQAALRVTEGSGAADQKEYEELKTELEFWKAKQGELEEVVRAARW